MFDSLAHLRLTHDLFDQWSDLMDEAKVAGIDRVAVLIEDFSTSFDSDQHRRVVAKILQSAGENNLEVDIGLQPKNLALVDALAKSEIGPIGYKILKFHPRDLGCDINLFSKTLNLMFNLCRGAKAVLYVCTYRFSASNTLDQAHMERQLQRVAASDRSVKIVLIHGFTTGLLQASELVRSNDNLFLDLSWTLQKYAESSLRNDIIWLMKNLDQRIIFGTDWPENPFSNSISTLGQIMTEADLEPVKAENILWRNAEKIFANE